MPRPKVWKRSWKRFSDNESNDFFRRKILSHGEKLTISKQIEHMKKRGIAFDVVSEEKATRYLEENNNYFKLRAYRKNYSKNGEGKHVGLDFAYLRDIAIIDM